MAGLSDISGGRSNYGRSGGRSMFDDLAARAMQTQELPVMPQMGYAMPSMPMVQSTPFAQYAWRTMPDMFGGLGVQPLTGYPSQYPHVLNGAPESFFRWLPVLQAMMPPMQPLQWPQQNKQGQKVAAPVQQGGQNPATITPLSPPSTQPSTQTQPTTTTPVTPTAPVNQAVSFINGVPELMAAQSVAPPAPVETPDMPAYTTPILGDLIQPWESQPTGLWDWIVDVARRYGPDDRAMR
ncbi:MAG: hypothetical protein HDQ88_09455 [Clostridia bacterium]|nr:hypothetical protein [Clostridia bacterium]